MSYDILLGYTGIVSFGHALFFGTGAYMTGIIIKNTGPTLSNLLLAVMGTIFLAVIISLIIGYLSLRVKDVYYAMITLAFAELFFITAEKWRSVTNGADGFSFQVPSFLQNRVVFYYGILIFLVLVVLLLRRFINSPVGRVLQAIRENEKRAEFLGYDVLKFKLISTVVAGVVASLAGIACALQQRFVSTGVMTVDKTIDALLMTTIGGTGTLYGALLGSGLTTRKKNMYISGGENIVPPEIETLIYQIQEVHECCVIGVPDPKWGEVGKVIISFKSGQYVSKEQVLTFLKTRLASYKVPKYVISVEEVRKNSVGKIVIQEVVQLYGQTQDDQEGVDKWRK